MPTPSEEIKNAIYMYEQGMCPMDVRTRYAERVLELASSDPQCAEWATWFQATQQWNREQNDLRDAWRTEWLAADKERRAVMLADLEKEYMRRLARYYNTTHAEAAFLLSRPLEYIDRNHIPYWITSAKTWIACGYDMDVRGGRAFTAIPRSGELLCEKPTRAE